MTDSVQTALSFAGEKLTGRLVFLYTRKVSLAKGWESFHKRFVEPPRSSGFLDDVRQSKKLLWGVEVTLSGDGAFLSYKLLYGLCDRFRRDRTGEGYLPPSTRTYGSGDVCREDLVDLFWEKVLR
jgi:hypothetical protein